jgi:hypothetical protein
MNAEGPAASPPVDRDHFNRRTGVMPAAVEGIFHEVII